MGNSELHLNDDHRMKLGTLRMSPKFSKDSTNFYPGASSDDLRNRYEAYANDLLTHVSKLSYDSNREDVFKLFLTTLENFSDADTEDRERIGFVCEKVMDILEIDSSDGLLNNWLYGFDPTRIDSDA